MAIRSDAEIDAETTSYKSILRDSCSLIAKQPLDRLLFSKLWSTVNTVFKFVITLLLLILSYRDVQNNKDTNGTLEDLMGK